MSKTRTISVALAALALVAFPATASATEEPPCPKKCQKTKKKQAKQSITQTVDVKANVAQDNKVKVEGGGYVHVATENTAESTPTTVVNSSQSGAVCGCTGSVDQQITTGVAVDASVTQNNEIDIKAKKGAYVVVTQVTTAVSAPVTLVLAAQQP